jgi:hypothetical protein
LVLKGAEAAMPATQRLAKECREVDWSKECRVTRRQLEYSLLIEQSNQILELKVSQVIVRAGVHGPTQYYP